MLIDKNYYLDSDDLFYKRCYKSCKTCNKGGDENNNNCIEYYKTSLFKEINNENFTDSNLTSNEINKIIYNQIINVLADIDGLIEDDVVIEAQDNSFYQLTTLENEGKSDNSKKFSKIDLGECENVLRAKYNLNKSISLIMLKYEKISNSSSERNLQYEIYEPINKTKLDLSVCKDIPININVPVILSENLQGLHDKLKDLGYDIFDINNEFYQDICTPYRSSDGTDVLLSDRVNSFFKNDETQCQPNCHFSEYFIETQNLKCECNADGDINVENKEEEVIKQMDTKSFFQSFYEVFIYSNYKILKCYKLSFSANIFNGNKGNYISFIYFFIYLTILLIYFTKKTDELKEDLSNLIIKNIGKKHIIEKSSFVGLDLNIKYKNLRINTQGKNGEIRIINNNIEIEKNKRKSLILRKHLKNINKKVRVIFDNPPKKNFAEIYNINNNKIEESPKEIKEANIIKKKYLGEFTSENGEHFDNYELNNLEYNNAIKYDKRNFIEIYWSLLKRQHPIIFTFFSKNDHNILLIKFSRFIFSLCTDMALNAFFFSDETMHKMYLNYGKYNFVQQIPQIIYSTLVSQLIDTFLCYLSLSDQYYYRIKKLKIKSRYFLSKIIKIIRLKIYFYFAFTGIMFVFYWYIITCFCEVYVNTQGAFIKDSLLSFGLGIIIPFVLYLIPTTLRLISLKFYIGKLSFIYKLSDIIPFF